jgi:hypothetical protein
MKKKISNWYFHHNLKPQGPISEEEMRVKIIRGEIGPEDLVSDEGGSWRAAAEWGIFEFHIFPAKQVLAMDGEIFLEIKEWVILVQSAVVTPLSEQILQEGPFSARELIFKIEGGHVSPYQYVWKNGLSGWCQIKDRSEFASAITSERMMSIDFR